MKTEEQCKHVFCVQCERATAWMARAYVRYSARNMTRHAPST